MVEAEVDPATGWITVPKIWIAHDIGRTINPVLARGQVEGSVYMGLCEALMEEQVFRRLPPKLSGALVHKIPSLLEYKSLTSLDMPEVDTVLIEDPDPNCPFGAKEVGQGPLLPVMPAVANAIYDAVGVRIDELPITPDKVLRALEKKSKGEAARVGPGAVSHPFRTRSRSSCRRRGKAATATRSRDSRKPSSRSARHDAAALVRVPRAEDAWPRRRASSPARARTRC